MMKKKKSQKPTEIEASLKYICPDCQLSHWIFLKEARVKNYKIVCDCGTIFVPKQISRLKVLYKNRLPKQKTTLSKNTLSKCSKILIDHGFSKTEAIEFLNKAYGEIKTENIADLIKTSIKLFGDLNVKF